MGIPENVLPSSSRFAASPRRVRPRPQDGYGDRPRGQESDAGCGFGDARREQFHTEAAEAEGEVIVDADFQDVPEEAAPAEEAAPVEEAASAEETVPAEETKPEA